MLQLTKVVPSAGIRPWVLSGLLLIGVPAVGGARPVPDNSLLDGTVVSPAGDRRYTVTGGTLSENGHLFHSFDRFSVPAGGEVVFQDLTQAATIFSRVTGGQPSRIDGTISVTTDADLVLLNPNGILFGSGAALNLGGAFLATTADAVLFDGGEATFSATNPQPPLLTLQTPTGLQFGNAPGPIAVDGATLSGGPEHTTALVGGRVTLSDAQVTARQGRIEIGAIAAGGLVGITSDPERSIAQNWRLNYAPTNAFDDIQLSARTTVAIAPFEGEIQVQGRRISMVEESQIGLSARREGTTTVDPATSNHQDGLTIRASQSITLIGPQTEAGEPTSIFSNVAGAISGEGRELRVITPKLTLRDGAQISATNSGSEVGVALGVVADRVQLRGASQESATIAQPSGLFARVDRRGGATAPLATGQGGELTVVAGRLTVQDGATISTSTFNPGRAGNLSIQADTVLVEGTAFQGSPSSLFAAVNPSDTALGDGGDLTITANRLVVRDGGQVGTTAQGSGSGGRLTVNADQVRLSGAAPNATFRGNGRSGLFVSAEPAFENSQGALVPTTGDAGQLRLEADTLVVDDRGLISADNFGVRNEGAAVDLTVNRLVVRGGGQIGAGSLLEENATAGERGPGGDITITAAEEVLIAGTGQLDQPIASAILTQAEGTGDAGNILITGADGDLAELVVTVRDGGRITAEAIASAGGNIQVQAAEIRLVEDGDIRTNVRQGDGGGGDITLTAGNIIAFGDSDILAFAQGSDGGTGGNITLDTPAFFGEGFDVSTLTAPPTGVDGNGRVDINASGATAGAVSLPDVSFIQNSLATLPEQLISTETLIANSCVASDPSGGTFVVTGAGGLQARPGALPPQYGAEFSTGTVQAVPAAARWQPGDPIVEAQGVYQLPNGHLIVSHACASGHAQRSSYR